MLRRKLLMAVAAAAVAGLFGPASARAGFALTLSTNDLDPSNNPIANVVVNDGGANDTNNDTGGIGFTGTFDGLNIKSISTVANGNGVGNVLLGSLTNQQNTISNDTGGTKTITISMNNDQFSLPGGNGVLMQMKATLSSFKFNQGGPNPFIPHTGDVTITFYAQGIGSTTGTTNILTVDNNTSTANIDTQIVNFLRGNNYALASFATVTLADQSDVTFDSNVNATATPAPATAILALAGAPIFGAFGWMRRRKAVVA